MTTTSRARRIGFAATAALGLTLATAAAPAAADAPTSDPTPSSVITNQTLTILGTPASDRLALRLAAGEPNTLQVDFGDDGTADQSFDRSTFNAIDVLLLGGNDEFRVDQTNGAFADEALTVDGGAGDDTILGGDGNDVIFGGAGSDFVDGNRGHDVAFLGSGADTFRWDAGDGSDDVDGGAGMDTLVFNGAGVNEQMSLAADGARAVFLRNPGTIRMNLDDVEQLDLNPVGGADSLTVSDTSGTALRQVNVDESTAGVADGQVDTVTINGTDDADRVNVHPAGEGVDVQGLTPDVRISGNEATDVLDVNTLGGNDTVRVEPAANAQIDVNVDLGAGQL